MTFPTDIRLCNEARQSLVKLAKKHGLKLRQTYVFKAKKAEFMGNRYMAARQMKRGRKKQKEVRNYLGRVMRDIIRKLEKQPFLAQCFEEDLAKSHIAYAQSCKNKPKEKLYSWHAPEVECIAKGKASRRYEFGCKASYATTNKSNFIIGAIALHGKPYDGHTLDKVLQQVIDITDKITTEVQIDQGYRGHKIETKYRNTNFVLARQKRGITAAIKRRQKRRNAIEPIIGHLKNDRKVGARNWLKGKIGDKINAISMAIGFNLRKILKKILLHLIYNRILMLHFDKSTMISS